MSASGFCGKRKQVEVSLKVGWECAPPPPSPASPLAFVYSLCICYRPPDLTLCMWHAESSKPPSTVNYRLKMQVARTRETVGWKGSKGAKELELPLFFSLTSVYWTLRYRKYLYFYSLSSLLDRWSFLPFLDTSDEWQFTQEGSLGWWLRVWVLNTWAVWHQMSGQPQQKLQR